MKFFIAAAALVACAITLPAQCTESRHSAAKLLCNATEDFQDLMNAEDRGVPRQLLDQSACIIVVPNLKKGGFIVGAEYGRGLFSCRRINSVGWSSPGFVRVVGGKFGLLIGGAEADIVMLVMNKDGMRHLVSDKFQLGGEVSAAAGPVGRNVSAMTDAALHAEILTYSRQRGIFGGIDLSGSAVMPDNDLNFQLYGEHLRNREIVTADRKAPEPAVPFIRELNKFSARK